MSSSIDITVQSIRDNRQAKIKLTLQGGEHRPYDCIFKEDAGANFFLVFPPDTLPLNIDTDVNHPVSITQDNKTISLNSSVVEIIDNRRLYLVANGTLDPASLREYFRVNTSTEITASYFSNSGHESSSDWSIDGITQDLSGSGVLAQFLDEPRTRKNILLEISLQNKQIQIFAHIVRKKKLRNKRWQVSFHFDNISIKNRDAVLAYLFQEQRRQLRENVNVQS